MSGPYWSRLLELDPSLEGDHACGAVAAETDAQQSGRGRDGAGDCPKACLCSGFAWCSGLIAGQCQIGMVEDVEELRVQPEDDPLGDGDALRHVYLGIRKVRPPEVVAA